MAKVYQAEAYRPSAMGSLGDASYMLLRQHQFPDEYDENKDEHAYWDHDRIMQQKPEHGRRCLAEHLGSGELTIGRWVRLEDPEAVIAFLRDMLEADPSVKWTGFRVLGTVNRSNGYPVYTLELFAKHPESETEVFDTENAPNLIVGSRHAR